MWLNATRRGQEPYALEIQRNDQFQPGAGAGLSLGKEAAFDLGLAGWIGFWSVKLEGRLIQVEEEGRAEKESRGELNVQETFQSNRSIE